MTKKLSDIKFISYTTRFSRLYVAWQDEKVPRRSDRLRRMLARQLNLDFRHYKNSGQFTWAQEQEQRRRKGFPFQPLPVQAGKPVQEANP